MSAGKRPALNLPGEMNFQEGFSQRFLRGVVRRLNNLRIAQVARRILANAPASAGRPIAFFKASTGIDDLSWNSGFHLLVSWALRLQGVPVVYFACEAGMSRCVLGTQRDHVEKAPPCRSCIHQSRTLYAGVPASFNRAAPTTDASRVHWFDFARDAQLEAALASLPLRDLMHFEWPAQGGDGFANEAQQSQNSADPATSGHSGSIPLGALCLPGLRWIMRRHNLEDNDATRFLLREYILSSWNVAQKFSAFLNATDPRAVVVFNGQFFPEAVARCVARKRGVRVITHEVGLQPASAFFSDGEATAYPIRIPDDFELSDEQSARLDVYLERRFEGRFSMAGIRFWPSMRGLDQVFLEKAKGFRQIVPIFTNVIFDTSQPHANTVFRDMFEWLDMLLDEIRSHPDTLFVIRAHPDETRVRKESRETVEDWVGRSGAGRIDNVVFIAPKEYVSSYELIQRAKFVMVYNSTIGLEASILGIPVLCGGKARFTQYPTVFFPQTSAEQARAMREFLAAERIVVPSEYKRNARRFLYYQLFRTSLPFGEFLEPSVRKTQARLKAFDLQGLVRADSVRAVLAGLLADGEFLAAERNQSHGGLP
ncbi:MAG: hypothetical protein V1755_08855 [Chloroflexota bacterium]